MLVFSRRLVLIAVSLALALVLSCSRNPSTTSLLPIPVSGNPIALTYGETKILESDSLQVTFDTVESEGRCPRGAVCYWEGMATIGLLLKTPSGGSHRVSLSILGHDPEPDTRFQIKLDTLGYRFTLLRLTPYPDIDTAYSLSDYMAILTVFPFTPMDSVDGEVLITSSPPTAFPDDSYELDSIEIDGDVANLYVHYSGGCTVHDFELIMTPAAFLESNPVQADLYLSHESHNDPCDAWLGGVLSFDLRPVAHLYELAYGQLDPIVLNVHNLSDSPPYSRHSATYYPDSDLQPPMFPASAGNYWIYAETTWTDIDVITRIDSVAVTASHTDSLGDWWLLSDRLLELGDTITVVGDSIYSYQCCHEGLIYYHLYREREYIPAGNAPFTYGMILFGDLMYERTAARVDSVIEVPAGRFAGCYEYTGSGVYGNPYRHILAPGIGFIYAYSETGLRNLLPPPTTKTVLLRYHIEE